MFLATNTLSFFCFQIKNPDIPLSKGGERNVGKQCLCFRTDRLRGESPRPQNISLHSIFLQGIALRRENHPPTQSKKAAEPLFLLSVPLLKEKSELRFTNSGHLF
jgi:hypothetical protein